MKRGLYTVQVQNNQLRVLLDTARLRLSPEQLRELGKSLDVLSEKVRARAVRNVSGYPVSYDGQAFRVNVRTGALKGSLDKQWPYQSVLQARVFVDGSHVGQPFQMGDKLVKPRPVSDYAAAIEYGHAEIDLKKFMLGKTVPFFAARSANATGPYAATGLVPLAGSGEALWQSHELNNKLQAKGKGPMVFARRRTHAAYTGAQGGGSSYYIAFRKVGKTGWVIPAAKQRPFMRAAVKQSERDARSLTFNGLRSLLDDAHTAGHQHP